MILTCSEDLSAVFKLMMSRAAKESSLFNMLFSCVYLRNLWSISYSRRLKVDEEIGGEAFAPLSAVDDTFVLVLLRLATLGFDL